MNIQNILCWKCKILVSQRQVKIMKKESIIGRHLCYSCKEIERQKVITRNKSKKQRQICSDNMKKNNPMKKPEVRAKMASTITGEKKDVKNYILIKKDRKKETREEMSIRMKKNNPMFKEEIRRKVRKTFIRKMKEGKIVFKRGQDHHLYRGNRVFHDYCRNYIRSSWTIPIIIRDGRKCTICGSSHEIQVHHLKPFKYFLNKIKEKYNFRFLKDIPKEDCDKYCQEILEMHTLDDGITVCKECHQKIDPQYRGGKYNKNKK